MWKYPDDDSKAALMASDCRPLYDGAPKRTWRMSKEMRRELFEKTMQIVLGDME